MTPTIEHARKIVELLSYGLVKGLGKPIPGEMCVEALVNYALGLPHGDEPPCVGFAVRNYKIRLNDMSWPSNKARAEGMAELAIAQLGSDTLDQEQFRKEIFLATQKEIIPLSFDYIKEENRSPKHDELKQFCVDNTDIDILKEKFKSYYCYNYHYFYYYNYHNYYYYNYNYYNFKPEFLPILLKLSADVGVAVLKKMNSPGCAWLHLLDEP